MFKKICVVGLGYIGLPTAAMFASRKLDVVGVDVSQHVVDTINKGKIHIVEPDLDMVVNASVKEGFLKASTTPEASDAFLIAVPTPFKENKQPNLDYIKAAIESIAPFVQKGNLIVLESTSPVGTTEQMAKWLAESRPDLNIPLSSQDSADIYISHCPERVLPGHVMRELVENDRVVGGMTKECAIKATELYQTFVRGECIATDCATAEMAKLTENAFRDVNISFANELSVICDRLNINVWELISIANRHPRVNILQPGPGVGGHCIAVDPWFIVSKTPDLAKVIKSAREVNDAKPLWVLDKLSLAVESIAQEKSCDVSDVSVCILGLAFKPDIDDLRESPALDISHQFIQKHSGQTILVEPNIESLPALFEGFSHVRFSKEPEQAIKDSDLVVLLVDHSQFKALPHSIVSDKHVIDTRGIWSKNEQ